MGLTPFCSSLRIVKALLVGSRPAMTLVRASPLDLISRSSMLGRFWLGERSRDCAS